jgi:3-hydroxybutyryl-CoA dehydrogenase
VAASWAGISREALAGRVRAGLEKLGVPAGDASNLQTYARLADIDWNAIGLVVEAATEDLPLKQKLFLELEGLARPDIPLASNTSNFPIREIGQALKTRARVLGLHFFMPAHLVPLVEVVSAQFTDPEVASALEGLMHALGKTPIRVNKDIPGFVGNRLQHALMREALYLVADGVTSAEGIDAAVRYGFGFRFIACGPMLQKEMSGWDTNYLVASALYPHLCDHKAPPAMLKEMVEKGHLGMKARQGFWKWTDESVAHERARIERALRAGFDILRAEQKES